MHLTLPECLLLQEVARDEQPGCQLGVTSLLGLFVLARDSHPRHKGALLRVPPPSRFLSSAPGSCVAASFLPSLSASCGAPLLCSLPHHQAPKLTATLLTSCISLSHCPTITSHGLHFANTLTLTQKASLIFSSFTSLQKSFTVFFRYLTSRSNFQRKEKKKKRGKKNQNKPNYGLEFPKGLIQASGK